MEVVEFGSAVRLAREVDVVEARLMLESAEPSPVEHDETKPATSSATATAVGPRRTSTSGNRDAFEHRCLHTSTAELGQEPHGIDERTRTVHADGRGIAEG